MHDVFYCEYCEEFVDDLLELDEPELIGTQIIWSCCEDCHKELSEDKEIEIVNLPEWRAIVEDLTDDEGHEQNL